MAGIALHDDRANGDAGVHGAVVVDVPDGAGVETAAEAFELFDDLHGAHFGRAADGAGGKGGLEQADGIVAGGELALHVADDVHYVAVALDHHHLGHLDGTVFAHASQVIAAEVDQHHVFSPLFGIVEKPFGERVVLGRRLAAPAGAGDGMEKGAAVFEPDVHFGAGADDPERLVAAGGFAEPGHVVELEKVHVGGRVQHAEGAIDGERLGVGCAAEALAGHDLENVTRGDVLFGPPHNLFVFVLGEVAAPIDGAVYGGVLRVGEGLAQVADDGVDASDRVFIGSWDLLSCGRAIRPDVHVGDDEQFVLDVIEDDQVVAEEQEHVGDFKLLLCGLRQALDETDGVVAEVADRAAGEARQPRDLDGPAFGQQAADGVEGIAAAPFKRRAVA